MTHADNVAVPAQEHQRAEWAARTESFAREGAPKTKPIGEAFAALMHLRPGERVLDIATGTGTAAIAAAQLVGPTGMVVASDFVAEWEPHVRATAADAGVTNVTFAVMPAQALDLPDASVDVVLCQFGIMLMTERIQALREMRRVLRPGGRLGIAVWSVPERVGLFQIMGIIGAALPPPVGEQPPGPTSLGAPGLLEDLLAEGGFADIVVQRRTFTYDVESGEGEWQRLTAEQANPLVPGLFELSAEARETVHQQVVAALEARRVGDVIRIENEVVFGTATR